MKSYMLRTAQFVGLLAVAGAIGFAAPASVALAQGNQSANSGSDAPASKPGSVGGVVVKPAPKVNKVPPHKKAAFDAEVAHREAWNKYRKATPSNPTVQGQNAGYPGLHTLASH